MFIYTIVATIIVTIPCLILKNTSIYDPYWSVAPFVMTIIHMVRFSLYNVNSIIFAIIMFWYAFRLTRNWVITYKGLDNKYEDWRYAKFRKELPFYKLTDGNQLNCGGGNGGKEINYHYSNIILFIVNNGNKLNL